MERHFTSSFMRKLSFLIFLCDHNDKTQLSIFIVSSQKENDTINDTINSLDRDQNNHIKENKYITILELSKLTDKSTLTVQRHLNCLTEKGIIRRVGSRKTGYWKIIG